MAWNKKEEERRKIKPISFSDEEGHRALEWLETKRVKKVVCLVTSLDLY